MIANRARRRVFVVMGVVSAVLVWPTPALALAVNCNLQLLQPKIDQAQPGATIFIKGTCHGNFKVNKDITLRGNPTATLNGAQTGSVLTITGTRTVHLRDLLLTDGASAQGGGIKFPGEGALTLDGVNVRGNIAVGQSPTGGGIHAGRVTVTVRNSVIQGNRVGASGDLGASGRGGGIYVLGDLTMTNTVVRGNLAVASSLGHGSAQGAGILAHGRVVIADSQIEANQATSSGRSAHASGGGLGRRFEADTPVSITRTTFATNVVASTATGGGEGDNATAYGGAVFAETPTITVASSVFQGNRVSAESAGSTAHALGGAIMAKGDKYRPAAALQMRFSQVIGSVVEATGATAATGSGGGVSLTGGLTLERSSLSSNTVDVHSGNDVATARGGGADVTDRYSTNRQVRSVIMQSTIDRNTVDAASDQAAASAGGAGLALEAPMDMTASTVSRNRATSTIPTSANSAAYGGGLSLEFKDDGDTVFNSTITGNRATAIGGAFPVASGGGVAALNDNLLIVYGTVARNTAETEGGTFGASPAGGGLFLESAETSQISRTILAANTAVEGPNCFGPLASFDYNLVGAGALCGFTPMAHDQVGAVPGLDILADNGGPTETMRLVNGSPALDAIPPGECGGIPTDQRLVPRPQGAGCDIGAFERGA